MLHTTWAQEQQAPPSSKPLAVAEIKRDKPVDFQSEVLPVLKNNCLACHGQSKPKGGLVLETPQTIRNGGDSGPALLPGKSEESLLFKAAAHRDPELVMPPRENKVNASALKPEELGLLKLWIEQGATGEVTTTSPIEWRPLPQGVNPIYAVALTLDGQFAACGRANQIFVYHLPSGQLLTRLTDPQLVKENEGKNGAAHRDLVHSLAFSPDGHLLASGGYREVKLWRRPGHVKKYEMAPTNAMRLLAASPDGKWLATASTNGVVALWDAIAGKEVKSLAIGTQSVVCLKFSGDGLRLFAAAADRGVRILSVPEFNLVVQTNLANDVVAATWLGQKLAVAGEDNLIRLWAVPADTNGTMTFVKELKGHGSLITGLDSLGTNQIVSGSAGGSVRVWDVEKGEVLRTMKNDAAVTAIAVRPDGKRIASLGANGTTRIWDPADGKQIAEMKGDRYAQEALAAAERDLEFTKGEVAYHKSTLERAEKEFKAANDRLGKATESFSAADKSFGEKQKAMQAATDTKTSAEKALADLNAELKKVTDEFQAADKAAKQAATDAKAAVEKATQAKLSADQAAQTKIDTEKIAADAGAVAAKSKSAISNGLADAVKAAAEKMVVEAAAVAEKAKIFAETAAADAVTKTKLAADAKTAADKAIDEVATKSFALGQLKPQYDKTTAESPEKIKQATEKVTAATNALVAADKEFQKAQQIKSVAEQESQLARKAAEQGTNLVAEAKSGFGAAEATQKKTEAVVATAKAAVAAGEKTQRAVAFSMDNITLATVGDDQKVHTWSAESGAAFDTFSAASSNAVAFGSTGTLVAFAPDGKVVAWDLRPAWSLERTIGTAGHDSPLVDRVNAVRFNHDGSLLATGGGEPSRSGEIKLWKVADGSAAQAFTNVHSDAVLALDFSLNGKYLASGAADKFVRIIDLTSGKVAKSFEGHTHHVLGVSWKRDGRTVASSGADNVVKVWDFVSGERKKNIEGFSKEVTSVTFVGSDQALASSGDTQVRLVKEGGDNVRAFSGSTDYVYSAAATPDGKIVVAGGQDSMLRVWNGTDGKSLMSFPPPEPK